ncbi:MAG: hypothetical protein A2Y24_07775 [Clostridiales bacterium GWE2_32_10]|nr:MAG: hypothetical protein A2Y24_07775 [Clostridiales bacterium GWE2_32_10]HBY20057.1 DJ-1 family protein [Clostridiales bacterium]
MVYIFLAEGFEEIEAITPVDILRRGGVEVTIVSMNDSVEVKGGHGITVLADKIFDEADFSDADMLILPGGGKGTENLSRHGGLISLLTDKNEKNKYIAAICAAPIILGQMGILAGKSATCYPSETALLKGAKLSEGKVVQDSNIITSRGPGTAHEFGLKLVSILKGKEVADKLNEGMLFKRKFEVVIKEK